MAVFHSTVSVSRLRSEHESQANRYGTFAFVKDLNPKNLSKSDHFRLYRLPGRIPERFLDFSDLSVSPTDMDVTLITLPELVWENIIEKLYGKNDNATLQSLYNASPSFFGALLKKERTKFLFPQVWNILRENQQIMDNFKASDWLEQPNEVDPDQYIPHLTRFKKLINLRKVCRQWRYGIDKSFADVSRHYIEKGVPTASYSGTHMLFEEAIQPCAHFDQDNKNDTNRNQFGLHLVQKFVNQFSHRDDIEPQSGNPFIGNALSLSYNGSIDEDASSVFWGPTGIIHLLARFGHHVKVLLIDASDYAINEPLAFFRRTFDILQYLPNLECISVDYVQICRHVNLEHARFPYFPKLHYLAFYSAPANLANLLLRANPQIKGLQLENLVEVDDYCFSTVDLPFLEKLSVNLVGDAGEVRNLSLPHIQWPLKELHMRFDDADFVKWSHLFEWLSRAKWSDSLTYLSLKLPEAKGWQAKQLLREESLKLRFDLKSIKKLKITVPNFTCMDFLLPLGETLKELKVIAEFDVEDEVLKSEDNQKLVKHQALRLLELSNRIAFEDSNIFRFLPELGKVSVKQEFVDEDGEPVTKKRKYFNPLKL